MRGFTLVEILVVVAIFGIIFLIIINSVILSNRAYWKEENSIEIMQNGRVVLDAISREVRQSKVIVSSLSEDEESSSSEIIFQDGHLPRIVESGMSYGGSLDKIILDNFASQEDDFYKGVFIKIVDNQSLIDEEIRKIISYDGNLREATIDYPFSESENYFGLNYMIDSSYYYNHYYLEENFLKRKVYAYYFSGDNSFYVPFNAVPPSGEEINVDVLEESRIVGEHFQDIRFWGTNLINISIDLKLGNHELVLYKKIFGRNL